MKKRFLDLMWMTGAFTPFRLRHRRDALILTYHRFGDGPGRVSARAFAEQLDYLTAHYNFVTLADLAARLASPRPLPPGLVAITIDDGYRDAYEVAYPPLRAHKVPATIFVVTDFLDRQGWLWTDQLRYLMSKTKAQSIEMSLNGRLLRCALDSGEARQMAASAFNEMLKRLPEAEKEAAIEMIAEKLDVEAPPLPPEEYGPLSWAQVREMASAGIEIGSHTVTHPILTRVSSTRLSAELSLSRSRIECETRQRVESFCYPNGNYNAGVAEVVARAGYRCAVTTKAGWNRPGASLFTLRRIPSEPDLPHFAQATSGFEELKNRLRSAVSAGAWRRANGHAREVDVRQLNGDESHAASCGRRQ